MKEKRQDTVLSLNGVSKSFGGVHAVQSVTLDVPQGQRRIFIGTNGAGKTTLFNLIAGDYKLTSGSIQLFGQEISKMPMDDRARLGLCRTYQTSALFNTLTVAQNLYLAQLGTKPRKKALQLIRNYKKSSAYSDEIYQTAERIELKEKFDTVAEELSHGERRQLEFGLATIRNPRVLMLDEPSSGLSESERQTMLGLLKSLSRDITLIMIDHNMEVAFSLADYVTVMFDGQVIMEGVPEDIRNNEKIQQIYLGGKVG